MMEENDLEDGLGKQSPAGYNAPISLPHSDRTKAREWQSGTHEGQDLYQLSEFTVAQGNHISFSEVEPINVEVRNLSVSVDVSHSTRSLPSLLSSKGRKVGVAATQTNQLLRDVSASMPAGTLTAIIGGSGSGKTTLLSTLAERMKSGRLTLGGTATFNGYSSVQAVRSAYVMQQDILQPTLTVRETLCYAADLRLPPPITENERRKVVEEVILELGLKECADTRIGNSLHKGCSGGERRRASIGVQLLSNPSVLFLDEPTTGLDAASAFQLVRTLEQLAKRGRTIITTIHQPRSEIWGMFDGLVILTTGSPVYSGKAETCLPWFSSIGVEIPVFVNPAEFLIDIAAVDKRSPDLEAVSLERVERLRSAWKQRSDEIFTPSTLQQPTTTPHPAGSVSSSGHPPFTRQVRVLTSRTFLTAYRDPMGMAGSIGEAIFMGILTGWIFLSLDRSQSGIRSREGAFYTAAALQGYLTIMFETYRLSIDIQLFDREHNENVVDVIPYLLSRRFARFFVEDLPVPLLYSLIFYWMAGFTAETDAFLIFFSVVLLMHYIAVTLAMTCIAAARSFPGASLIANLGYTVQTLACGYLIQSDAIPVYVRWLKWTAYMFYAYGALVNNEFKGQFYDCPLEGGESNPACAQYTGTYVLESLGVHYDNWIIRPILVLVGYSVIFYILAGIGLSYIRVDMTIAKARTMNKDLSVGKEKMTARDASNARTVDIRLDNFALFLDKRTLWGRKLPTKTILNPLTTKFSAGVLNVIMGPSGSGKTSLLNAMAMRLHNTTGTQYGVHGNMTFNGAVPSDSIVRSVCSYVCQDDDALLPSLTVRETIRFAAALRLPSFMSTAQKYQRAENILLKMGLKDCADVLIGSELIKGISGGEKRRVTIALQILTEPRVLLLDEPTSGLDAFTASSIVEVLQGLVQEGRTIILTLHQPRSDLFKHFGNVLLLARGGFPVYAGSGTEMLPHFSSLGYFCPPTTNPADFALDLITIDLQNPLLEAATGERVHTLISSWSSTDNAASSPTTIATPAELGSLVREYSFFFASYPILVHRGFINFRRQPSLISARIMQVVGMGIITTLFFAPLKYDYSSIQTRFGFTQQFCAYVFVGLLQNIAVYPSEKDVFYRENDDGIYGVEAFLAQYITLEVPFEIIECLLFACLVDLGAGLPRTTTMFFVCFFNGFCLVSCGESIGIMFNTLFAHTGFAVNITAFFLSLAQTMAGVLSINMPSFLTAMNHLSPLYYAMRNLGPYSLRDIKFTCNAAQRLPSGECTVSTGLEALELYNIGNSPARHIMALGVCTVIYRVLAYVLLKLMRMHWTDLKAKIGMTR